MLTLCDGNCTCRAGLQSGGRAAYETDISAPAVFRPQHHPHKSLGSSNGKERKKNHLQIVGVSIVDIALMPFA
jgi:hypothetical protein